MKIKLHAMFIYMRIRFVFFAVLFVMVLPCHVLAVGYGWLDNAAIKYFTSDDIELMLTAMSTALDNNDDGDVYYWKNPKTGTSGSVTPLATAIKNGMTCRKTRFINNANGVKGDSIFVFCNYPDNKWKAYTK